MKDGIRNQLEGLETERKRLETLMSSDPAWNAYRQLATTAAGTAEGPPALQELPDDIAGSLRENRLFRAWVNLVAAADSLRELLEPEDLPQDGTQDAEGQQKGLDQSTPVEPSPAETVVEREAFRTKLILKSDAATVEKVVASDAPNHPDPTQEQLTDVEATEQDTSDLPSQADQPSSEEVFPLAALLLERANSSARITQQLVAIQAEPRIEEAAGLPEASSALPSMEVEPPATASVEHQLEREPDDLGWISGVGSKERAILEGAGLSSFAKVAAITPEQLSDLRELLPAPRDVSRQQWIEQAAILASGQSTVFVRSQGHLSSKFIVEEPSQTDWEVQPLPVFVVPETQPTSDTADEADAAISTDKQDDAAFATGNDESVDREGPEKLPLAAAFPPLVTGLGTRTDSISGIEVANDATAVGEDPNIEDVNSIDEVLEQTSEADLFVAPETELNADEAKDDHQPLSAQSEELALSERLERFERSMSEVSLPDLRRPRPFELNGTSEPQATTPPNEPPTIGIIPVLPPISPPVNDAAIGSADNPETQPSQAANCLELPTHENDLSEFDLEYDSDLAPAGWDEANVEIVRVAKPDSQQTDSTETMAADVREFDREELEQTAPQPTSNPDPSPYDLARRMERLAEPPIEPNESFSRFSGDIEEASVQIIRAKPSADEVDMQEPANPPQPATNRSAKARNTKAEPTLSKRSSRRFLDALTGSRKAR